MERMVHRPVLAPTKTGSPIVASRSGKRCARSRSTMLRMIRSSSTGSARQSMLVDGAAIAQHRDAVGDAGDLVQFVRDQDRGDALRRGTRADDRATRRCRLSLRLAVGSSRINRRTRLDSALAISTSCCLPTPRSVTSVSGCSLQADLGQQFPGPPVDRVAIDDAEPRGRVRQEDVLRDRHQRNQRQLLVDDDDAERLGIVDIAKAPLLAVEDDRCPHSCRGDRRR